MVQWVKKQIMTPTCLSKQPFQSQLLCFWLPTQLPANESAIHGANSDGVSDYWLQPGYSVALAIWGETQRMQDNVSPSDSFALSSK